ncbi:hypothetical protein LZC95_05190 [Pendulispora brunnea]|uniref:Uncharacterized protein n=1 Tax=Pendulispora brunnea TaxID=2905690 RepID=A0ABZ2KDT8_9BACT
MNIHSNGHLLFLLADLARDRHLVDRLALDAPAVFQEYGVPQETLTLLRSRNVEHIVAEVARQAALLLPVVTTPPHGLLAWAWPEEEEKKSIEGTKPAAARTTHATMS